MPKHSWYFTDMQLHEISVLKNLCLKYSKTTMSKSVVLTLKSAGLLSGRITLSDVPKQAKLEWLNWKEKPIMKNTGAESVKTEKMQMQSADAGRLPNETKPRCLLISCHHQ